MARIQEIDRQMMQLQRNVETSPDDVPRAPLKVSRPVAMNQRRVRRERGELKGKVIAALRAAGKRGITIGDLSKKLGVKRANLYVWFDGTGRNIRGLRKVAPAKYRLGS